MEQAEGAGVVCGDGSSELGGGRSSGTDGNDGYSKR